MEEVKNYPKTMETGGRRARHKSCKSQQRSLGPDLSMYKVETSPPFNLDIPHVLVAVNTQTHKMSLH